MRKKAKIAVLIVIGGMASCSVVVSKPLPDPQHGFAPVKLLAAERNYAGWSPSGTRDGKGTKKYRTFHSSWKASSVALGRLEGALLNNSWVSITEYGLDGGERHSGRASQVRQWIDCSFSNGRELRIFFSDGYKPRIVDGWKSGDGKFGYRLNLSEEELDQVLEVTEWGRLEEWEAMDEPLPESDEALSQLSSFPGVDFSSKLSHDPEVEPASVLNATRPSFRIERTEGDSTSGNQVVAQAQGATLSRLEEAVQGMRWSILWFSMDGRVHLVERNEDPIERILCHMSDGQTIEIKVFSSDGAWCVSGEGSFRLALSESDARELLNPAAWEILN